MLKKMFKKGDKVTINCPIDLRHGMPGIVVERYEGNTYRVALYGGKMVTTSPKYLLKINESSSGHPLTDIFKSKKT